jgi:hypothetical protein
MKQKSFAAFVLVAAVAISLVSPVVAEVKATKEALHGTWTGKVEIDEAALKADEKFKEIPAEQADLLLGLLKQQLTKMTMNMTFKGDGTASAEVDGPGIAAKDKKKEGMWEVVKIDGAKITVKIESKGEGEKDAPKEMVFTCVDDKTMTMGIPGKSGVEMPKGIVFKFTRK